MRQKVSMRRPKMGLREFELTANRASKSNFDTQAPALLRG